jgi:hypothetical protein
MDRRDFIKAASGTTVGLLVAGGVVSDPARAAARADFGVSVFPFPLSQVTLLDGPFKSNMGRTRRT